MQEGWDPIAQFYLYWSYSCSRLSKGLGIFQPLADGLKFLFKEEIVPGHLNKFYYYLAPIVALVPALTTMTVLPLVNL